MNGSLRPDRAIGHKYFLDYPIMWSMMGARARAVSAQLASRLRGLSSASARGADISWTEESPERRRWVAEFRNSGISERACALTRIR